MGNKEIQEQRMKGYFIQATKDLLKGEGLKHVSVRNIAQKAGYSYATLYNYFKDAKDLIFECVKDFQQECRSFIELKYTETDNAKQNIKEITKNYILYFIEYPGIFELFFIEKTTEIENKQATIELINSFLNSLCEKHWQTLEANGKLSKTEREEKTLQLNYTVTGMLLFYNHRKYPSSYNHFLTTINNQLNLII